MNVIHEAHINSVSTRKIERLAKSLLASIPSREARLLRSSKSSMTKLRPSGTATAKQYTSWVYRETLAKYGISIHRNLLQQE